MISISGNAINNWDDNGIEELRYPLFVISAGYQKFVSKNFKIVRHKGRLDFQFIYLIKGKGFYNFRNAIDEIGEGNLIVYQPGQPQYYEYFFAHSTELYWMHFSGSQVFEWLEKSNLSDRYVYNVGIVRDCIDLFKRIIYELQIKKPLFEYIAGANLLELMFTFSRKLKTFDPGHDRIMDETIKKITTYMYENYRRKITIGELANLCNLSLFRFIHKFKDSTGMTPVEYLTRIRINEAKYLLSNSPYNIAEISSIVGYNDPLYFSRVFKKIIGVSPKNYKSKTF